MTNGVAINLLTQRLIVILLTKEFSNQTTNFQMNETDIARRASNLRNQAICRLNGVKYEEPAITSPKPQALGYELKNEQWFKSDIDYQTLIVIVASSMVIFSGYSFYVGDAQRDYLLATTNSRCISDVTIKRSVGKSPKPYFNDAQGQLIASCFEFRCSYKDWYGDVGKAAKICLAGGVVVSIETDGKLKMTREKMIYVLDNSIWWDKFWGGLGGICLAIFSFLKRKKWMESIRSRFPSIS